MVDFINEVEEELRKDKYNELLRKYGPYLLALIFVIIAATGFREYRVYKTTKIAKAASASYVSADEMEKKGELQKALSKYMALSKVAPTGYSALSLERAAGIKVRLGDYAGAVSLFDQAASKYSDRLHKDLAALKAAYLLMDDGKYADVELRTKPLTDEEGPYRDLAQELQAQAALKSGDVERAKKTFTYLANAPGVQAGVKARAGQALALMKAAHKEEKPEETRNVTPQVDEGSRAKRPNSEAVPDKENSKTMQDPQ